MSSSVPGDATPASARVGAGQGTATVIEVLMNLEPHGAIAHLVMDMPDRQANSGTKPRSLLRRVHRSVQAMRRSRVWSSAPTSRAF